MKPDWQRQGIQLYCGDCLDILPTLADNSIDTVVLGPSFGGASGTSLPTERLDSSTIAINGDFSAGECFVGTGFEFKLELSQPFLLARQMG